MMCSLLPCFKIYFPSFCYKRFPEVELLGQEGMHGSVVCKKYWELLPHCSGRLITLPNKKKRSVQDKLSLVKASWSLKNIQFFQHLNLLKEVWHSLPSSSLTWATLKTFFRNKTFTLWRISLLYGGYGSETFCHLTLQYFS